jgi:hypothetical protein
MEKVHNFFEALGKSSEIIGVSTYKAVSFATGLMGALAVLVIAVKWLFGDLVLDWGAFTS